MASKSARRTSRSSNRGQSKRRRQANAPVVCRRPYPLLTNLTGGIGCTDYDLDETEARSRPVVAGLLVPSMVDRPILYLCCGSHLAARGVAPTQVFSVLVRRGLRTVDSPSVVRPIHYSGDMTDLARILEAEIKAPGSALVVLPRNMHGIPMLLHLGGRKRRLAQAIDPNRLAQSRKRGAVLLRRALAGLSWTAGLMLTIVELGALPRRLRQYREGVARVTALARRRGCRFVILSTPVPLPLRHFPGALHQLAYGALIRGQSSTDVTIVDLSRALRQAGLRRCLLRHDPLHMTAAGHRLVAEQILSVLQPRLEGRGAPARSSSR